MRSLDRLQLVVSGLGVLCGALALGLWLLARNVPTANAPGRVDAALLEEKLEALRVAIDRIAPADTTASLRDPALVQAPPSSRTPGATPCQVEIDALESDLERLESQIEQWMLSQAREASDTDVEADLSGTRLGREAMSGLQEILRDRSSGIEGRAEALRLLQQFPEDMDPLGAVLPSIEDLYFTLTDPQELSLLTNALDETRDERIVPILLAALDRQQDDDVKRAIVRSLRKAVDMPGVALAMEGVAKGQGKSAQMAASILQRSR